MVIKKNEPALKNTLIIVSTQMLASIFFCGNLLANPISGYAQTSISNININFSNIDAVNVIRKGMYPAQLNGTHAESQAIGNKFDNGESGFVSSGITTSNSGTAHSSAGVSFIDIAEFKLSNDIYNDIDYVTFPYGSIEENNSIRSSSVIFDYWLFTVNSPVDINFSFDYYSFASGPITTPYGDLIANSGVGLGMGRNDTIHYNPVVSINDGIASGTMSMSKSYNIGDYGRIYLWTGSDVLASQSAVPEPAIMLLFGTGLTLLVVIRGRRSANFLI